jgi:type II secretory pathway pseudopilin PulG
VLGILASIILVRINESRAKSRDARRIADLRQVNTGLEMFYNVANGYPDSTDWNSALLSGTLVACNDQQFFMVPEDPLELPYFYTNDGESADGCGGTIWSSYEIEFDTEAQSTLGPAGTYYLTPAGFSSQSKLSAAGKARKTCPPKSKGKGCAK